MDFVELPIDQWSDFFDGMTEVMRGRLVEIDVIGLELGALVEAEWVPLNGITYEQKDDALYVLTDPELGVDHTIFQPRQVFVELGVTGVSQVVAIDSENRKHIVRLRAPLELPEVSGLFGAQESISPAGA